MMLRRGPMDGAWHCVEALGLLIGTGRSLEFGGARRRLLGRDKLPPASAGPLARARALRLLGRGEEARALWERARRAAAPSAEAWAGPWELALASRAGRGAGLEELEPALALAPRDGRWRAYRALGLLLARPRAELRRAPRGGLPLARTAAARSSARRALSEAREAARLAPLFALGPIVAGLACAALGRPREAAHWLGRACRLASREGWLRHARGAALLRAGDLDGFASEAAAAHYLDEGAGRLRFDAHELGEGPARRGLRAVERLLAARPRLAWALALRADLKRHPELNDAPGALADLRAAARLAPREAWIRAHLSRALLSAGDAAGGLREIDRASRLRPDCAWIRAWRGETLRRLGRHGAAERELNAAIRLAPDYELAYAWRGGARRALGRPREALRDLELALALAPSHAWAWAELSLALRALGRVDEALDALDRARRLDPKSSWCARPEQAAAAVAELDRRLARRPDDARALAWRGETRLRAGDPAGAEADLAAAAALAPGLAWIRAARGRALAALGRQDEAAREFDAALAAEPGLAEALAGRAAARLAGGRARAALRDFARAAAAEPRAAWIHAGRGEAARLLGRRGEAREAFRRAASLERAAAPPGPAPAAPSDPLDAAIARDPASPAPWYRRALARRRKGDWIGAALDLDGAARLNPRCSWLRAGASPARAEAELSRALARHGSCVSLRAWRGELRLSRGDVSGALEDLLRAAGDDPLHANARALLGRALRAAGRA